MAVCGSATKSKHCCLCMITTGRAAACATAACARAIQATCKHTVALACMAAVLLAPYLLLPQLLFLAALCHLRATLTACQVNKVDGGSGDSRGSCSCWLLFTADICWCCCILLAVCCLIICNCCHDTCRDEQGPNRGEVFEKAQSAQVSNSQTHASSDPCCHQ